MKKTLISLLALAGLAVAETTLPEVDTVITYTSDLGTGSENGGGYQGVIFTLNPINDTGRFEYDLGNYTMPSVLELTSITITGRTGYSNSDLQMVVIDDNTKKIVGISSGTAQGFDSTDSDMTFTFSGVELSTKASSATNSMWYRAFFVKSTTAESLTLGGTVSNANATSVNLMAQGPGYSTTGNGGGADWGFVNVSSGVQSTDYVPVMTITTKVIPEPATATLSLLALAGLAARRRRK